MRIQEPAWLLTAGVVFVALLAAGSDAGKSVTVNGLRLCLYQRLEKTDQPAVR